MKQDFAFVYIDDTLLLSNSKEHKFQIIEQLHINSTKNILKLAPEKPFFMLLKVNLLGHEIGYNTIKPIHSKLAAFHKIHSPTGKVVLMSFVGALNFYIKFIEKLLVNLKPFMIFYMKELHGNVLMNTTVFSEIKNCLSLLKQNIQYQTQNTHFSLQKTLRLLD